MTFLQKKMQLHVDVSPPANGPQTSNLQTCDSSQLAYSYNTNPHVKILEECMIAKLMRGLFLSSLNFGPVTDGQTDRKQCT